MLAALLIVTEVGLQALPPLAKPYSPDPCTPHVTHGKETVQFDDQAGGGAGVAGT